MERPKCPLIDFGCRRNACAWWDIERHCCLIDTIVASTNDIAVALKKKQAFTKQRRESN